MLPPNYPAFTPLDPDPYLQVLWFYAPDSPGARQPGSFHYSLIESLARADHINTSKLGAVYPQLTTAVQMAKTGAYGGLDKLKEWGQQALDGTLGACHD